MARFLHLLLALAVATSVQATESKAEMEHRANPIRKVVNLLMGMQKKVEAEGEKEEELYEKFMCYCKNGGGDLTKSITAAETKIPQLTSDIEEGESKLAQLKEDLESHGADRTAAKAAMAEATAVREKEKAAYDKETSEDSADLTSTKKAIAALEGGLAAGFLQTQDAQSLRRLASSKTDFLEETDRTTLAAFLSTSEGTPGTSEIIGILKTMSDEMTATIADITKAEESAVAAYEELMAAKTKEVDALTKAIEEKMTRVGELSVSVAEMKNDLEDTEEALAEDKKVLASLEKSCKTKTAEWEERQKTRSEELVALADTIKVLNDDDALDLFKKTLPGAGSASFMQVQVTSSAVRAKALALIQAARKAHKLNRPHLDFIALALRGKKIGFEKVIAMIDGMVATLKTEQADDDSKKEYCAAEFDKSDDKKKALERSIKDLETAIADAKESIASAAEDIEGLTAGITALDKAVAEATAQRKEEHSEFTELMASDSAAKEVLGFAKNRLNKFYNPKLYKPPPKRELSEDERITLSMGGTLAPTAAPGGIAGTGIEALVQVHSHARQPETWEGGYEKKSEESTGVIAMIDLLIKDLDKEMTIAEAEEKDAQADYETMMKDSADKRAQDSKALEDKEAAKANMEADLQKSKESKTSATKELGATLEYISSLHSECDWLLQYYTVRKEARAGEVDALGKAKAVLSGADYSLIQTSHVRKFLRRA